MGIVGGGYKLEKSRLVIDDGREICQRQGKIIQKGAAEGKKM